MLVSKLKYNRLWTFGIFVCMICSVSGIQSALTRYRASSRVTDRGIAFQSGDMRLFPARSDGRRQQYCICGGGDHDSPGAGYNRFCRCDNNHICHPGHRWKYRAIRTTEAIGCSMSRYLFQTLKNILCRYKNHRSSHLIARTPTGIISGASWPAFATRPERKNSVMPLKSTNLCRKYIVMGLTPITTKNMVHLRYPLTSIIQ